MLADGVSAPVQSMLGATGQEIHDTSNMYFLRSHLLWIPFAIIAIYLVSFLLLSYLENYHEDDDGMIPYKRDLNGRRIRKQFIKHPYIDECYRTYEDFMK